MPLQNIIHTTLLDTLFRGASTYSMPTTVYLGLWNTKWNYEANYTDYDRISIALDGTTFSAADTNGESANTVAFTFPTVGSIGGRVLNYWVLLANPDAASPIQHLYAWGDLADAPVTVVSGDTISFDIGDITISFA